MARLLITGASGLVGKVLTARLQQITSEVMIVTRRAGQEASAFRTHVIHGIDESTDWTSALRDQDIVIHLAGQVPSRGVRGDDYFRVNDRGTRRLVAQAAALGVRTFVFISSIAAVTGNAATTSIDDATNAQPQSDYGRSKLAAEAHVAAFAAGGRTGISLRPPLVYGGDAKGNWKLLQRLADSHLPVPFASVRNSRTLISVDNFVDAIIRVCTEAVPAKSGTYVVSDAESVSLGEIVRLLRKGMGRSPRQIPLSASLMAGALAVGGKRQIAESLFGDLEVDPSRFQQMFDWHPFETAADGIRKSGAAFKAKQNLPTPPLPT